MQINKINLINYYPQIKRNNEQKTAVTTPVNTTDSYNPIAYRDYNISFGTRLFRSPENFYEQSFNKENMPESMKLYLNGNYEDRQHIPPAQMMKIVFDDIKYAETLEDVKELSDDPLFKNLHSQDNKKHRDGILAEIALMKEPGKSLFKNGKDDLGIYIVKKIYLEGKTLKEINNDFKKDVSVHYNGLSDINYQTLANFGIKFPKLPFWKSFIATREDFPYVPIKRKDAEFHSAASTKKDRTLADILREKQEKPKFDVKDFEIKKMTDSIIEGHGDIAHVEKELKRKGIKKDSEKGNFVSKYLGPIMNITLDRIHASDEMRTYFSNYESLNATQKKKFKDYWKEHNDIAELQSLIMSDTIKLFFETYGADGNNEEFKDLLDYANSIKPIREENIRIHNELQEEYEKELGIFETEAEEKTDNIQTTKEEIKSSPIQQQEELKKKYNMTDYKIIGVNGKEYTVSLNLKDAFNIYIHSQFDGYLPKSFINKYAAFIMKNPKVDDNYKISCIMRASDQMNENLDDIFMPEDEIYKISKSLNNEFVTKYPRETRAAMESIVKASANPKSDGVLEAKLYEYTPFNIMHALIQFEEDTRKAGNGNLFIDRLREIMNREYSTYLQPVKNAEASRITSKITAEISKYNPALLEDAGYKREKAVEEYITALSMYYNDLSPKNRDKFDIKLYNYIQNEYGGSARALLDEDFSPMAKRAKIEDIILDFARSNPKEFVKMLSSNLKCILYLQSHKIID